MERIITASLSVLLFTTIYSLIAYTPDSYREANVLYFGFFDIFLFVIIYAGPVYFIAGVPISMLIDNFIEKSIRHSKVAKYLAGLGMYSLSGAFVGIILVFIFNGGLKFNLVDVIPNLIYGLISALIYFHLSLLLLRFNVLQY